MTKQNVSFHLSISFENIEMRGVTIHLKNFHFLNDRILN